MPIVHPAAERPVDADITAVLRGLNDFSPKPWPAHFRELQAAGGRIDITQARVQRQREQLTSRRRRPRTGRGAERRERGLLVQRDRIVNQGLDALGPQVRLQRVTRGDPDREEMVHVSRVALGHGTDRVRQLRAVPRGECAPAPGGVT